jgi:hypothetical protein
MKPCTLGGCFAFTKATVSSYSHLRDELLHMGRIPSTFLIRPWPFMRDPNLSGVSSGLVYYLSEQYLCEHERIH